MWNRHRTRWLTSAGLLIVIVTIVIVAREPEAPLAVSSTSAVERKPVGEISAVSQAELAATAPTPGPTHQTTPALDQAVATDQAFRLDSAGELVIDEHTRLHVEALLAQSAARDLYEIVREDTDDLPVDAARAAQELVDKLASYQQAQRQTFPPDAAPATMDDAVTELRGLHALREAHFGAELAQKLFGKEEAIAQEMIELLRIENDPSLTSQEKLARARELRAQLPEIASIENRNRDSVGR